MGITPTNRAPVDACRIFYLINQTKMKNIIELAAVCALMIATALSGYFAGKHETAQTLENRVFARYGGGDMGCELLHYLKTGENVDFMGNPIENECAPFDYCINVNDCGTVIYTPCGKFIDFVPFDSISQFDRAILADNL